MPARVSISTTACQRPQRVAGDDAGAAEQGQRHRHLERDAEGEDQPHHDVEVLAGLRQELDRDAASGVGI